MVFSNTNTTGSYNWELIRVKLKKKFPVLTDADLHFEKGVRDDLFYNLQSKLGKSRRELRDLLNNL